jgi:hypothetical protein
MLSEAERVRSSIVERPRDPCGRFCRCYGRGQESRTVSNGFTAPECGVNGAFISHKVAISAGARKPNLQPETKYSAHKMSRHPRRSDDPGRHELPREFGAAIRASRITVAGISCSIAGRIVAPPGRPSGRSYKDYESRPWQCLYFFPEPHGHRALRGVAAQVLSSWGSIAGVRFGVIETILGAAGGSARANSDDNADSGSAWLSTICIIGGGGMGRSAASSTRANRLVTRSFSSVSIALNSVKASDLYSFSGSRCP